MVRMTERTGAERYLSGRLSDPEYRGAYDRARHRIAQIDNVIRAAGRTAGAAEPVKG